jgi:antirestriction protein ArdC
MLSQTDLRQSITNTIIEALTNGDLPPWRKMWADDPNAPGLHTSLSTGSAYRGINQLLLQISAMRQGFKSRWWGTFNQIKFNGASVRQGQKGTKVVLWKPIQRKRTNEQGKDVEDSFLVMREFCVWNAEQSTGLDKFRVGYAKPEIGSDERHEKADAVIDATGADIRYGGNGAFYNLMGDFIQLPNRHQFENAEAFYETAFHELGHWTEHANRLNWNRAEEGYAMGELIAEISACMMLAELGLPTTANLDNHAAYLKNWLDGMSQDTRFIFKAASQANKVVDYLLSFSRTTATVPEAVEEPVLV